MANNAVSSLLGNGLGSSKPTGVADKPGATTSTTAPAPTGNTPYDQLSAAGYTLSQLTANGVPEDLANKIVNFMTGQITGTATPNHTQATPDEALGQLYDQSFFKQRFPNIASTGLTPAAWIQQEQQYYQTAAAAGMPGFVDAQDAAALIQGHVTANELSNRLADAYNSSQGIDPNIQAALKAQGITSGDLAKFFLDPDTQVNELNQKVTTAQVAGVGADIGFEGLTTQQAAQLAAGAFNPNNPTTRAQVTSAEQQAAANAPLTHPTLGASPLERVSAGTVLGAEMGVGVGGQTVSQEQRNVQGAIETTAGRASGGGGYSPTKRGTGVGYGSEQGASNDAMGG